MSGKLICLFLLATAFEPVLIETDQYGNPLPTPTVPPIEVMPSDHPWQPGDEEADDLNTRMAHLLNRK